MNRSHPDGRRSWRHLVFWATCLLGLVHVSVAWAGQATSAPDPATRQRIAEQYGKLPLSFIQNRGQVPEPIEWYVQRPALHLAFTPQGQQIILRQGQGESART
ncbi:MAG: hypothetical protein P9F19_17985 [Candidatus Contendobacter sp.]|nr:hypothetical protein [Candidatus Contendobacter sp.]MDG4559256.1 hypothetical protein [Candidatus Contendobacter sp.]